MTDAAGPERVVRVAAVADLHHSKGVPAERHLFLGEVAHVADVLALCGDLTDNGLPEEAQELAHVLAQAVRVPIVAVLGNHDYESGREGDVRHIFTEAGVTVLDGEACEVLGVGFAGAKGFAGGFGRGTLGPWGEPVVKAFVQEAVNEALKLETALARLRTAHRVALLHYSPISATAEGEPPEIYPFLGCSRLEEPINRFAATVVFHGHAHHGTREARTSAGIPVHNVSLPLLRGLNADQPFTVLTLRHA
jgi:Icc-related predicted phosphoesterase